jgi:hypothetical protein
MKPLPLARLSLFALGLAAAAAVPVRGSSADETAPRPAAPPAPVMRRPIDLVLCLDTSGSMTGLIHAARQKMWEVVNELAAAKPMPRLRVALLTYGSPGDDEAGHVVVRTDLTEDLDTVSERLFALGTNGGDEYVGRVVKRAVDCLAWSGAGAAKILFVAGNESADQDRVAPFRDVMRAAAARGIRVNAIYCGGADDADAAGWREVAALGGGRFASIDHDRGTVAVKTPFDAELEELSRRINLTYVAYGREAEAAKERQRVQDANAASAPAAGAARAEAKGSGLYRNAAWDLVDRMDEPGFDLAALPAADLPEEMRKMDLPARREHLAKKRAEREAIRVRIQELGAKRQAHVREEMARKGLDDSKALDRAVRDAVREQAVEKGFSFEAR